MKYIQLCEIYEALAGTTKRLEKIEILSEFFKKLTIEDKEVMYLLLGRVYPAYSEEKIGISHQTIIKALAKVSGVSEEKIVGKWRRIGDIGEVAEGLVGNKKQSSLFHRNGLTIRRVLEDLRKLPGLEGKGTVSHKIDLIAGLLLDAKPVEAKYLVRTLINDLRVGIFESTIREAMADAFFERGEASVKIQHAYDVYPDMALIFENSKKGLKSLEKISLKAGMPVKAMLAQKVNTIAEGFEKVGRPAAFEYKYDGFRILISKEGDEVKLFTRRLDDVSRQFPDVVNYVRKFVEGKSFILDSEVVGFDRQTKKYLPFQAISQRIKRKYEIEKMVREFPVEVNVFDLLFYNGKSYLDHMFKERTRVLRQIIKKTPYKLVYAKQLITGSEKKAQEFFYLSIADNQEGLMSKNLEGIYRPGSRVGYMIKLKPEHRDLDLVIVGAEYGTGKRAGWLSSFILACRDGEEFVTVGKVGTGIKEKVEPFITSPRHGQSKEKVKEGVSFLELTKILKPLIIEKSGRSVKVKPRVVVSVIYQEIQKSPTYSSGYALRFPRVVALREDKPLSEINKLKDIEEEYRKQR